MKSRVTMSNSSLALLISLIAIASLGCRTVRRQLGDALPGDASVTASIDGLSEDERKSLKNAKYLLLCGASEKVEGKVDNEADPKAVHFEASKPLSAEAKKSCGLQIWANRPSMEDLAKFDFKWFAYPAIPDSEPQQLYYASSRDAVAGSNLKVTLYKLYSKIAKNEPLFLQPIIVKFPESETLPSESQVSANLLCEGVDIATTSGMVKATDPAKKTEATVTFGLPISKYKGKSCRKVLLAVAGELKFEAALANATLEAAPAPGSTAKAIGPVDLIRATGSNIIVNPTNGGDCLYFDIAQSKCVDKLSADLPREQNIWLALVSGKDASGAKVEVLVSGPNGLGVDSAHEHKKISRDLINADIAGSANKFTYYQASAKSAILNASFDQNVAGPAALGGQKKPVADLKAIKVYSIDEVYIHGFAFVAPELLNTKTSARWFAMVKATKGAQVAEFMVTGGADYFYSDMRRGGSPEQPAFWDWSVVKTDRDTAAGAPAGVTDFYDIYAFTGGAAVPNGCSNDRSYYLDSYSGRNLSDFPAVSAPQGGTDAKMEACEIRNFGKDYDDFQIEAKLYLWDWHKLIL